MKFGKLNIDIKDYMGKIGPGVLVVLSVIYNTKVYEAMYWYTEEMHIIELPEEIEKEIGKIEEHEEYSNIMNHLKEVTVDYDKVENQLEDIFSPVDSDPQTDSDSE